MSTGSSGCVLNKVNNLFTCEKKCNSVEARKALLKDFTSKLHYAEVVYVDNDGQTTEEEYTILFQLSETQKDSEMIRVHGNAIIQKEEETPIKCHWSGIYLANKRGYKMKLVGDNIEKDFYVDCDGNETINFLIKKTASENSDADNEMVIEQQSSSDLNFQRYKSIRKNGLGSMQSKSVSSLEKELSNLTKGNSNTLYIEKNEVDKKISSLQLQILQLNYTIKKNIPNDLIQPAYGFCGSTKPCNIYNFCNDSRAKVMLCINDLFT
jgi:hypothetical protein